MDELTPERQALLQRRIEEAGWGHLLGASWGEPYRSQGQLILEYGYLTQPPPEPSRVMVLLQNAWIRQPHPVYSYLGCWPREDWLWATARSLTGQRLRFLLVDEQERYRQDVWWDDATPRVAVGDSGIRHPADSQYVQAVLQAVRPRILLACGGSAVEVARAQWPGPLIATCHPAYRFTSRALLERIKVALQQDDCGRISILPAKGGGTVVSEL